MAEFEIPRGSNFTYTASGNAHNSLVLIDSTHGILAYSGVAADGFIETFSWDSKGETITSLNVLEHDTTDATHHSLVKIDATHFVLAYADAAGDGFIKTFSIDGSFVITQVDSLEHDATDGIWASCVLIDSTHIAVAYSGVLADGFIKTFSFDSGTAANITEVDSLEHDIADATYNSLVLIDATHLALAYTGVDGDGFIKTFSMDGSFVLTQVDVLEHDTVGALWSSLVLVDTTHLLLAYTSPTNEGYMKTFSIDASVDNITLIDSLNYETENANHNSLVLIDSGHMIVAHSKGNKGHVQTLSMDSSFDNITNIDDWEHDASKGDHNSLIKVTDTLYMLAHVGVTASGVLQSVPVRAGDCEVCATCFAGGGGAPGVGCGGIW